MGDSTAEERQQNRQQRRANRQSNYAWNDGTFFWQDDDAFFGGQAGNTEELSGEGWLRDAWDNSNVADAYNMLTFWQTNSEERQGIGGQWGDGSYDWGDLVSTAAGLGTAAIGGVPGLLLADTVADGVEGANVFQKEDAAGDIGDDLAAYLLSLDFESVYKQAMRDAGSAYGVTFDEDGNPVFKSPQGYVDQANELNDSIQTFTEWAAENGIDLNDIGLETDAMQGLIDALAGGPSAEDQEAAWAHAARAMGMTTEELDAQLDSLREAMTADPSGMGMSPEERRLRERQNQANLREMEERAQRMVQNSMAETGSTVRMLSTADEATRSISNMQLQQDAALAQEEFERGLAIQQSRSQQYFQMVQANQMGYGQYIDNLQQGMSLAIEGYAQKIDALLQENEQYFSQYDRDLDAINSQIQNLYTAANTQLGINEGFIQSVDQLYQQRLGLIMDSIKAQLTAMDLTDPEILETMATIIDMASDVAGIATEFM